MLVGVVLPAFCGGSPASRMALVVALVALPLLTPKTDGWFIASYLPIFAAGILTFLLAQCLIPRWAYWSALAALGAYLSMTRGAALTVATIMPAAMIATVRLPHIGPIAWLGAISYSIYLVHVPIGGRVMNLAGRLPATPATEVVAVAIAFGASILAAYGLYALVERPARDLAASVRYDKDGRAVIPA